MCQTLAVDSALSFAQDPTATALFWWNNTLSLNEQKAFKARAGLPDWFPQHYGPQTYRAKLVDMYAQQQTKACARCQAEGGCRKLRATQF